MKPEIYRILPAITCLDKRDMSQSPMVFLTGPRQVGKTFLVRRMVSQYHNWDTAEVKREYLKDPYFFRSTPAWIGFDEIHKRRDWKKLIKGYFDSPSRSENFFVTGSGRFNLYQRGGDSLQGRYDLFHLYPVTFDEWLAKEQPLPSPPRNFRGWLPQAMEQSDEKLIEFGGFPAPLMAQNARVLTRWLDQYIVRLVNEDIRDFSRVALLDKIELLARLLPSRLGSPLSMQSLAEDIECSRETIKLWLRIFETLYLGFRILPYSQRIHRAVKKEAKWYFFQWAFADHEANRFENYLAVQLLTACRYWRDQGYGAYELYYLRDQDRREVDFVIVKDLKPVALVEAKLAAQPWSASLAYYAQKLSVPSFLVYPDGPIKRHTNERWSLPSAVFLRHLVA